MRMKNVYRVKGPGRETKDFFRYGLCSCNISFDMIKLCKLYLS